MGAGRLEADTVTESSLTMQLSGKPFLGIGIGKRKPGLRAETD